MANHISHFEIFASDVDARAKVLWSRRSGGGSRSAVRPDFYHIFTGPIGGAASPRG
jgi:hypothetical protein